jgi:PKD repeat protein
MKGSDIIITPISLRDFLKAKLNYITMKFIYLKSYYRLLQVMVLGLFFAQSANAQLSYCTPIHNAGNCAATELITNVTIVNTAMNNNVNACSGNSRYEDFTGGSSWATLYRNSPYNTYSLKVTTNFGAIISVWIDFDKDTVFSASEWWQVTTSSVANTASTVTITVPAGAILGDTRMRIRSRLTGNQNGDTSSCHSFGSGIAHDYNITIDTLGACTSPPTAGAITGPDTACVAYATTLGLSGNSVGAGQTFQWQSSPDSITWTNINGAIGLTYDATIASPTYFRCYTECSGSADTTIAKYMATKICYCTPTYTTGSGVGDFISQVTLDSINNATGATATPFYTFYNNISTTLTKGISYYLKVAPGTFATNNNIAAWIDYDQNGVFDQSEELGQLSSMVANLLDSMNFTVPFGASTGMTRMRVREVYNNAAIDPCTNYTYGEAEDYIINIRPGAAKDLYVESIIEPSNLTCPLPNQILRVSIRNIGTDTVDLSIDSVQLNVTVSNAGSGSYAGSITSGILAPGDTMSLTLSTTFDMSVAGTYDFVSYLTWAPDLDKTNDTLVSAVNTVTLFSTPYMEDFNTTASVDANYLNNSFVVNTTAGVGSTGGLRATLSPIVSFAFAATPLVGPLTSNSALRFQYKSSVQFSADDSLIVVVTTDCGSSLAGTEYVIDANGTAFNSFKAVQIPLGAYAGQNVQIGFLMTNGSLGAYNVNLDNVAIGEIPNINIGPDSNSCNPVMLMTNRNGAPWTVTWSTGTNSNEDTLTVFSTASYWAKAVDDVTFIQNIDTANIAIFGQPVVNMGADQTVCAGTSVTLDAGNFAGNFSFAWNNGATTKSISVTAPGQYIVTVTNPGSCSSSDTIEIFNTNSPTGATILKGSTFNGQFNNGTSSNPDNVCVKSAVSYEVTPPSGYTNADFGTKWVINSAGFMTASGTAATIGTVSVSSPGAANGSMTFTPSANEGDSTYMAWVTVKDNQTGCDTTVVRYIKVNALPGINLGNDQQVCANTPVTLNGGTFTSYTWNTGATTSSISPTTPGAYSVTVTDANGCINADTMNLTNFAVTSVNLGNDQSVCSGVSVTFDAGTASAYLWSGTQTTQTITVSAAGTYSVRITDANGCFAYDSVTLSNKPSPNAAFTATRLNSLSTNVQFTPADQGQTGYAWDFGDGNNSTTVAPLHVYATTGSYPAKLKVTNSIGCSDSTTQTIGVNTGISTLVLNHQLAVMPNPYQGQTVLSYSLKQSAMVTVELFDLVGKKVATVSNGQQQSGDYTVTINTASYQASQGVYMIRFTVNGESTNMRIVDLGK